MPIAAIVHQPLCVALGVVLLLATNISAQESHPSDALFGMSDVIDIHMRFAPDEWEKLQPPDDVSWDFEEALQGIGESARAGENFRSDRSSRPGLAGYLGIDHQYGMADVTIGDQTIAEVGIRYKGNGTFVAGHERQKFSFKIDFNEFHDDLEFLGLTKINLNNCVVDPSYMREALSYELFREVGIPASRTGWARVYLTIDGVCEREFAGIFLIVEQVDKRFLRRHYGSADGLLVKPSTFGAFRYLGDEWQPYVEAYNPKTDPTDAQQQRLIEFARLIHEASDRKFDETVEDYLDIDEFLTFLALNVVLSNLDSFLGGSQNYYAYLDPATNKFQVLPWDLDISFGAFSMLGTPDSRRDLSINRPQVGSGSNRLIERVLAIPRFKDAYHARLKDMLDTTFGESKMISQIDRAADFVRPLVEEEGASALRQFEREIGDSPRPGSPHALKYFVTERRRSIDDQLAGRSEGQHLDWPDYRLLEAIFEWIGVAAIAILICLGLNAFSWIWALIVGFRDSANWGLLNLFIYPIAPLIFGFRKRKDLGHKAAIMTLISIGISLVAAIAICAGILSNAFS